jgi:hypothetical protein
MRAILFAIILILLSGCISSDSYQTPLESVAAESPPNAEGFAYLDLRTLATNQDFVDLVTGGKGSVPAVLGHLLIIAPEARIFMYDGTMSVGFSTLGLDMVAGFAAPMLFGEMHGKEHLGQSYSCSSSLCVLAGDGRVLVGEEKGINAVLDARHGANALLQYSPLIRKLPKGDAMLVMSGFSGLGDLAASAKLDGKSARTTIVLDAGSEQQAQMMQSMSSMIGTGEGVTKESEPYTDGQYLFMKLNIDITKVKSIDQVFSMPTGVSPGGLPSGVPVGTPSGTPTVGPGGCATEDECDAYCSQHMAECAQFAQGMGLSL